MELKRVKIVDALKSDISTFLAIKKKKTTILFLLPHEITKNQNHIEGNPFV